MDLSNTYYYSAQYKSSISGLNRLYSPLVQQYQFSTAVHQVIKTVLYSTVLSTNSVYLIRSCVLNSKLFYLYLIGQLNSINKSSRPFCSTIVYKPDLNFILSSLHSFCSNSRCKIISTGDYLFIYHVMFIRGGTCSLRLSVFTKSKISQK